MINQKVFYRSKAVENKVTPIIVPGSVLDTGIKAENFTDVDRNSWSWKHIQQIAPLNIIVPPPATPTEFNPQGEVSRADMAQFLLKTYKLITGQNPPVVETPFTDIQQLPQELQDTIAKIYGLKITAGTSATTFSPDQLVNRAQMATFLSNLYKAVSGDYAPETETPFTDIGNEDIKWAVKPIGRIYGLKVTAGISPTEFGPYQNVTREQMSAFIFSFMRLFGPSRNNPQLDSELAGLHSVTYYPSPASDKELNSWLAELKQTGFNSLWLVNAWKDFNPRPLANPPVYDDAAFLRLTQTLDLLRQNNMKAILPLNYVGPAPEGINACRWTVDLPMYQAFETYVNEFLRRIEPYSDMVYILFFTEGSEPCIPGIGAKQMAALLRPTLGSLPQRLDPQLRSKFKIGYHDYSLINLNWASGESPIQMPLSYDFLSGNAYDFETKTDQEIIGGLNSRRDNFKKIYPFTPFIMGEFGAFPCNDSTRENQARVLKTGIQYLLDQNLGFNIWQWQARHYRNTDACTKNTVNPHVIDPNSFGIIYRDSAGQDFTPPVVSKPARLEIMKLLNPSVSLPQCIEQDEPVYGQKAVDGRVLYYLPFSICLPDGWSVAPSPPYPPPPVCTGEPVWLRNPQVWDGACADNNPYPSDCIPVNVGGPEKQYIIDDTCRPKTSPTPLLLPLPSLIPQVQISPETLQPILIPSTTVIPTPPPSPPATIPINSPSSQTPSPTGIFDPIIKLYDSVVNYIAALLAG